METKRKEKKKNRNKLWKKRKLKWEKEKQKNINKRKQRETEKQNKEKKRKKKYAFIIPKSWTTLCFSAKAFCVSAFQSGAFIVGFAAKGTPWTSTEVLDPSWGLGVGVGAGPVRVNQETRI